MSSQALARPSQPKRYRQQVVLNVFVPISLTLVSFVMAVEIGLRHFFTLIPIEVCAADYIIATYVCQPYFEYDKPMRLLSDFTQEAGIEFLNLTPVFWQTSIERGELYHFADPHWNQVGNELAADTIYEYVLSR